VDLYAGDLFPACYDEWILTPRERLRQRYLHALSALVDSLQEVGELQSAILYTQLLLRHDPLQEDHYRRLMGLHLANSDRAGVASAYRQCERMLRLELHVEPSAGTLELLRRAEELPGPQPGNRRGLRAWRSPAQVPGNLPSQTTLFIGRERQVVEISERLRRTECRLVTLTGTAGTGKTRLALQVAYGPVADEDDGRRTLGAVRTILRTAHTALRISPTVCTSCLLAVPSTHTCAAWRAEE
jgi:hypothetical protein